MTARSVIRRSPVAPFALAGIAATMVIAALAWSVWDSWRSAVLDSRRATAQIATSLALQADEIIDRAAALASSLVARLAQDPALLEPGNPRLSDVIAGLQSAAPYWVAIGVADASGRLVGASALADLREHHVSIAQQPSFSMHATGGADGGARISPPFMLKTQPLLAFAVGVALRDERGQLRAVALVSIPSAEILKSLDPVRRGIATHIALAHRDGFLLAAAPASANALATDPAAGWVAAMDGRAATVETRSPFSAEESIVSHEQLARFPVVAVATRDVAELGAEWASERRSRLVAYALVGLGVIALNLWLMRAIRGRLRAETRLRESIEARFRDGIESMVQGFMLWGGDDKLVSWNSRAESMLPHAVGLFVAGIDRTEFLAAGACRLFPDVPEAQRLEMVRRRADGQRRGETFEIRSAGRIIVATSHLTSDGGIVVTYNDVTALEAAQTALLESEERFRDFADAASDWFWETDPDDRFTFVSGGVRRMGVDPDELVGRTRAQYDALKGRDPLPSRRELEEIVARREVIRGFCFAEPAPAGGEPRKVEIHGKPVYDDGGRFLGYRGTGRDVTERDRQQAELARALEAERTMNAVQRRFVAIASHEFRTPLAVIDGATQRLLARLRGRDTEIDKRLDRIRSAVSRMAELIDRTLSSARLDEGRIEMQPGALDVKALLRDAIDRQSQISRDHVVGFDAPVGECPLEGDPKLLEQVFANLLSNAVKYSGRSRRIEVRLEADGAAVRIAVRDHGVGIPAEELPHLFTRFFRASTATGIPGTGIGLNLVRELVEMHGGTVAVESILGAGSEFVVTLPRRQPRRESGAAAA